MSKIGLLVSILPARRVNYRFVGFNKGISILPQATLLKASAKACPFVAVAIAGAFATDSCTMSSGWPGLSGSASPATPAVEGVVCGRLRHLADRFFEAFEEHADDASICSALEEALAPEAELHTMTPFRPVLDKPAVVALARELRAATDGGFATVDRFLCNEADGTWAVQYTFTGTFARPLWGLQPTGRLVSIPGTLVARCDAGQKRIVRVDSYVDAFSAATQLGVDVCAACETARRKGAIGSVSGAAAGVDSSVGKASGIAAAEGQAAGGPGSSTAGKATTSIAGAVRSGGGAGSSSSGGSGGQPTQLRETHLEGAVGRRPTA